MFEIGFHDRALKFYQELDVQTTRRINEAIEELRSNPFLGKDIKKLRGILKGKYRLRVGELRMVYRVEKKDSLVIVESIGHRGAIYR